MTAAAQRLDLIGDVRIAAWILVVLLVASGMIWVADRGSR